MIYMTFLQGCDGSVLINSTRKNQAEKDGIPNLSLRGFQVIDAAKTAVEAACPGVVSCADILSLVARDAIHQIKGPYWPVPLGRRDGRVSIASESFTLPAPFANITQLKAQFLSKGLNVKDLAVLSDFQASMVKMGQIGVLTGKAGEIRRHCALIN
uniref:peroxidase n=1 Tax=Lactuca sativa TaxID=4236 RepID=A0A9R1ULT4_LACSA|nr:hypothetical protein LSAT_V11C800441290 [Lactuca sativa]